MTYVDVCTNVNLLSVADLRREDYLRSRRLAIRVCDGLCRDETNISSNSAEPAGAEYSHTPL